MKKIFLTVVMLTLCLSSVLLAWVKEEHYKQADTFILTGTIDKQYPITMYLTIDKDDNVKGKYYYDNVRKYIEINGKIKGSTIELEEEMDNKTTGKFIGKFDEKNIKYSGTWVNTKTKKKMPFELDKNSIYKINHIQTFKYEDNYDDIILHEGTYLVLVNNGNSSVINNINKDFISDKNTTYDINEYETDAKEYSMTYSFTSDYYFHYIDENIISFTKYHWEYTGGAHGNGATRAMVFNIRTGKLLEKSIDDLIKNEDDPDLITLIQKRLKVDRGENEFFNFDQVRLNSNYYVDADGVHFIYSTYEIAPYSSGEIYLSFSFDELKPFVKKSSPFWYLFK